ncbi:hypothetical protein [Arabiibacter massiliensis]|uniref:hypothetical protein n=1 Tax=Arabiibacter massiliensis TaxID=1870985 RepID=UPI00117AE5D7|nr:hypothetical protein [Arabiibacter massiliensis]
MARSRFLSFASAAALGIALLVLGACAPSPGQEQAEPFAPAETTLDKSGLYALGESVSVGGLADEGQATASDEALFVQLASIMKLDTLPEGVESSDFRGGSFDASSAAAMKERLGFAPDAEGGLPEGYSYVLVEESVTNATDGTVTYDVSQGRFALRGDAGELENVGTDDPLWRSEWSGSNLKQYWQVSLEARESASVQLLYALPDDAIDAAGLAYLVDPGNANGEEGFTGLKAFDVAGQIQG